MPIIDKENNIIHLKLVYYGVTFAGKTSNLHHIYERIPPHERGERLSIATETDRTIFFQCTPNEVSFWRNMKVRVHVYTVPGAVLYERTRLKSLKGADGIVFVVDSRRPMFIQNLQLLYELIDYFGELPENKQRLPETVIFQYTRRDAPEAMSIKDLNATLNIHHWPTFESIANKGDNVYETFIAACQTMLATVEQMEGNQVHLQDMTQWKEMSRRIGNMITAQREKEEQEEQAIRKAQIQHNIRIGLIMFFCVTVIILLLAFLMP